jgi:hypothetical protein
MSSREDGSSTLEKKDHTKRSMERVKLDLKSLTSKIPQTLILLPLLKNSQTKKLLRKQDLSRKPKRRKKLKSID